MALSMTSSFRVAAMITYYLMVTTSHSTYPIISHEVPWHLVDQSLKCWIQTWSAFWLPMCSTLECWALSRHSAEYKLRCKFSRAWNFSDWQISMSSEDVNWVFTHKTAIILQNGWWNPARSFITSRVGLFILIRSWGGCWLLQYSICTFKIILKLNFRKSLLPIMHFSIAQLFGIFAMLCSNFQNSWATEMGVINYGNFARCSFNSSPPNAAYVSVKLGKHWFM